MTSSPTAPQHLARPRLRSVLVAGVLFLVLGALDLWRGLAPLFASAPHWHLAIDDVEVLAIGVAAIVGGSFVLRGANWARWLLAVWMAFHVAISIGQPRALVAHLVIFGFVAYLLFRSGVSAHFGPRTSR